jgi:hypothetical protein
MKHQRADFTPTPDRRYYVVRGRLWRLSNPWLDPDSHQRLVQELMSARRAVLDATTPEQRTAARVLVDEAKCALGERGDAWWSDGAPDYNRHLAINTPYAEWFAAGSPTAVQDAMPNQRVTSRSTHGGTPR